MEIDIHYRDIIDRNNRRMPLCEFKKVIASDRIQELLKTGMFKICNGYNLPINGDMYEASVVHPENVIGKINSIDVDRLTADITITDERFKSEIMDIYRCGIAFAKFGSVKKASRRDKDYSLVDNITISYAIIQPEQDSCYNIQIDTTIGLGYRQTPNKNGWVMKIEDLKNCIESGVMINKIKSGELLIQHTYHIDEDQIPHNMTENNKYVIGKVLGINVHDNTASIRLNSKFIEDNDLSNMELFFGYKCDMGIDNSGLELAIPRYIEYAVLQDKKESNYE